MFCFVVVLVSITLILSITPKTPLKFMFLNIVFKNSQPPEDHSPISRKEFVRFLLATPTKSELRCQVTEADRSLHGLCASANLEQCHFLRGLFVLPYFSLFNVRYNLIISQGFD